MPTTLIPLANLKECTTNVRRTVNKEADAELKASLLAHGLQQNLIVRKTEGDCYTVVAGARRLRALQELSKEEKIPQDYAVSCKEMDSDASPEEISLVENIVRQAMHPADEFE